MSAPARQQSAQQIVHVGPDTPVEEVIATYERDRVLIIDDLADEATLARLREDLEGRSARRRRARVETCSWAGIRSGPVPWSRTLPPAGNW